MPALGTELAERRVGSNQIVRKYFVTGATAETDVQAFVAGLPDDLAGLSKNTFNSNESEWIDGDYFVEVTWGSPQQAKALFSAEYSFNYVMPGGRFKQSLATIDSYEDAAQLPNGPPDFGGAINVVNDGGKQRVEGFDVQPPSETDKIRFRMPRSYFVSPANRALIRSLLGKVNSTPFKGMAAGEALFCRCVGGIDSTGDASLDFGFAFAANRTGLSVGAITGIAADGWDLVWTYYRPGGDAVAKTPIQQPAAAYVERIFERADLNALNLPDFV